jgi:tetratricopeptide (TPR) repeat protein
VGAWGLCTSAIAQSEERTRADLTEFAARSVERLALFDLRAIPSPTPADYAIADALLSIAQQLRPDDPEIVRRRIETAWNAGNRDSLMECTARLVELDPADTVAQLRLITSRLGRIQTAEERLAAYDRLLGPRGQSLDASVRSRLALDAALLLRERGDEPGFVGRLKEALRLDSTNKEAALLALNYYCAQTDDEDGRFELLSNLLLADPLDTRTIRLLRDDLARRGSYRNARRLHRLESRIREAAGVDVDPDFEVEGHVLDWMAEGPEVPVRNLTTQVESERAKVIFAGQMDPTRLEGPQALRPQDVRLDLPFEQVRAFALASTRNVDRDTLRASVADMEQTVANRMRSLADPLRRPASMTEEAVARAARITLAELHAIRILLGFETPEQFAELDVLIRNSEGDPEVSTALHAWKALHENRLDDALSDAPHHAASWWLDLARAEAWARKGEKDRAVRTYLDLHAQRPTSVLGAWAWTKAGELGLPPEATRRAARGESLGETIPPWLDSFIETPRRFVSLSAKVARNAAGPMDMQPVVVRLANLAPVPLALGSGRTLNSRLFFGPNLVVGTRARSDNAAGEVFELDRRLRLMPGEAIEAPLRAEIGLVGWLQETGCDKASRVRWRIIQGFETRQRGNREPGPGCVETSTETISRDALPEARLATHKLAQRFDTASEDELPPLLVAVRCKVLGGEISGTPDPEAPLLCATVAKAYPNWSATARLAAAASLPPPGMAPALAPLDEAMRNDQDPRVQLIVALTRTTSADDALLANEKSPHAPLLARHAERLRDGVMTYSRVGPRAEPLRPRK